MNFFSTNIAISNRFNIQSLDVKFNLLERERETHLLNSFKLRARICAKYNHLHLIFKEKLPYFLVAFVVYFLQVFPVETQCLRLSFCSRFHLDFHPRLHLSLKSFEKEIQGTEMSGNETQDTKMQRNKAQGNETQALRLYKCVCPRLQFLIFNSYFLIL